MSEPNEPVVADLVDAAVPADQGLAGLGLLMQLAGNVFAAGAALLTFMMLFIEPARSGVTLWMFVMLGLSIGRSLVHRSAGAQLVYGHPASPNQRMGGIRRYVGLGLVHSLVFGGLLFVEFHVPARLALGITGGLLVWPLTLAVVMVLPRFRRFHGELPITEDKGFEGASILMTVLGLCGVIGTGSLLVVMLNTPARQLQRGPGVLIVLGLAMLVVRSLIHVQAGLSGLRETSVDRSVELANRYANFGVISSFCGGGALMLFVMSSSMNVFGLALVCGICWMLMAWPLIVRRFFGDRQFADLLAGDAAPIHRRAPDAGLTWLGWLLVADAMYAASFLVPQLVFGRGYSAELDTALAMGGALGLHSLWWNVGLVVLQAWAGFELVRMSPQSRAIATVFGVVAAAVSLYINWPVVESFRHMHGFGREDVILIGPLAMSLIIPIATIVLVHRKVAPTARARFRSRPAPDPSPAG